MKKHIFMAAICASLTVFAACGGNNKQGTTDSSAVSQDSSGGANTGSNAGSNAGGNASVDSSANAGASSQSGAAAGDTSTNKQKPAGSSGATPQQ
jgi:type IV secretory pathway TrbL component